MYIYQNGKVYVQEGDNIVGVDISPLDITKVKGSTIKLVGDYRLLTPLEVRAMFGVANGETYIFPREPEKVVEDNGTTRKPKTSTRKPTGK